ncbi:MAG: putative Ig domain-containing protein [Pseudomonadota bacterium]
MIFRSSLHRLTLFERFLSIFTSVRPGEGATVRNLFGSAFLLTFCFYLLKPVREALLLSENTAELGAYLDAAVALSLIFAIPLYRQLYRNLAASEVKSRILRWVIGFFISNLLVFAGLAAGGLSVGIGFYIWLSIFGVMVVSQFWAFAADLFNTRSGQRLFVVIMVGSSIGAWTGAQTAANLSLLVPPWQLMLFAAVLLAAPLVLSVRAENLVPEGSGNTEDHDDGPGFDGFRQLFSGFDVVVRSRYLLLLGGLLATYNLVGSLGKYALRAFVRDAANLAAADPATGLSAAEYILRFYGDYNAWISLIGLLLQLFVAARLFRLVGVRGAILVLPVFLVLQFGILFLVPAFALLRVGMIGQEAIYHSIQNTTNQALFLPMTREEKYIGKTIVDTVFVRFGDCIQGLIVFVGVGLLAVDTTTIVRVIFFLTLIASVFAVALRRRYRVLLREHMANEAPSVVAPLPDVYAPAGKLFMFAIPEDCFFDPDPGDTLDFELTGQDGERLPAWIRFDRHYLTLTVRPPAAESGSLVLRVSATDLEGHATEARFRLSWGDDPTYRIGAGGNTVLP